MIPGHQINGGFVQSPVHNNKPVVGAELETSFSDARVGQLPLSQTNNNGSVPNMLPLQSPHAAGYPRRYVYVSYLMMLAGNHPIDIQTIETCPLLGPPIFV